MDPNLKRLLEAMRAELMTGSVPDAPTEDVELNEELSQEESAFVLGTWKSQGPGIA